LRLVAGFLNPDGGSIQVGDKVVSSTSRTLPPERRNMSMIFQSYALWPHLTIFENVAYGLRIRSLADKIIRERVGAILATTKLETFANRYPGELSGGQQQRVSLARALVVEPEILLLDEPLSNLDANLREEMRFEIRRLHDAFRYTTLYVTHDQSEAMTTADLIVVMNKGRIEQAGSPRDIYQRPVSEFVARFIGGTNIITGRRLGDRQIDCAGSVMQCGDGQFSSTETGAVSVRPHDVRLSTTKPDGDAENVFTGVITRHVYLGPTRDYMAALPHGQDVRIVTSADIDVPIGTQVWLHFPRAACRALAA
jgi:iron(III) transport system ATP-binding protein